jgi:hypothetical protein
MHASDCIAGDGCIVATLVGAPQYFTVQHDEETGPVVEAVAVTVPTQHLIVVGNERERWQHLTPHQREMVMRLSTGSSHAHRLPEAGVNEEPVPQPAEEMIITPVGRWWAPPHYTHAPPMPMPISNNPAQVMPIPNNNPAQVIRTSNNQARVMPLASQNSPGRVIRGVEGLQCPMIFCIPFFVCCEVGIQADTSGLYANPKCCSNPTFHKVDRFTSCCGIFGCFGYIADDQDSTVAHHAFIGPAHQIRDLFLITPSFSLPCCECL